VELTKVKTQKGNVHYEICGITPQNRPFSTCNSLENSEEPNTQNCWKKLLRNMAADLKFKGCEVSDFHWTI
jgi:hypothetical protein